MTVCTCVVTRPSEVVRGEELPSGLEPITSRRNPLVKRLRQLHDARGRREEGLILLEGTHLLQEVLRLQLQPRDLLVTPAWLEAHPALVAALPEGWEGRLVSEEVLEAVATTRQPDGVVLTLPPPAPAQGAPAPFVLALDGLQDPGNLGTLMRTALAAGVGALWMGDGADPFQPKVLRASAGAALALPLRRGSGLELERWLAAATAQGWQVVGVDPSVSGIERARLSHPDVRFEALFAGADLLERLEVEPFDLVVSTEVVEHLYAPREWATAAHGALRPGGTFLCSTPYHGYLKNLVLALTGKLDAHFTALWDGGHIKFWSRRTLTALLQEAGFQTLAFRGAGRFPWLWKSMLLVARKPLS
jgi:TrmH family RNA methyltransferase